MGIFKLFSSGSSSIYTNKYGYKINTSSDDYIPPEDNFQIGDPQPHRFNVEFVEYYLSSNLTLVIANYPDCQNYGGKKIMVYKNNVVRDIENAKILDPHFLEKGLSPFLRISPDVSKEDAIILVRSLKV